jgi:flagellar biogenesis protein FliO
MGDVSLVSLFARLVVSLAVVLGLMTMAGRALRNRTNGGAPRRTRVAPIEVLARQGLGRSASVTMVRAGGRVLVLGVTDTQVNLLAEGEEPSGVEDDGSGAEWTALPGNGPDRSGWTWKAMLDTARERTVRRS